MGAGEGERATLESCLESCLVKEADAFLEDLWGSMVFSTQNGEEEAFLCFFFLAFWGVVIQIGRAYSSF